MKFYIILFLLNFIFSQSRIDGVAATVGNNIILHSDVLQQAQFIALNQNIDPSKSPFLFEEIYKSTLNEIVNQYIVIDVAEKDTNIIISNDEVDRALNQQIDDFILRAGSEKNFLEMAGMSMRQIKSEYWKDIKNMMLVERFRFSKTQNIDVSRKEVENFYFSYKDSLPIIPETYNYSLIEIPYEEGYKSKQNTLNFLNDIKYKIESGEVTFDNMAIKHSEDPGTSKTGGYIGFTSRGVLVKEYEKIAYSLKINEISSPTKTPFGYHIIKLIDKKGEKISTQHILIKVKFTDEDKNNIIDSLNNIINGFSSFISFDSLANHYSNLYNNYSGKYINTPISDIQENIYNNLKKINNFPSFSKIFDTEKGKGIIYCYKNQKQIKPNLINSWNTVYLYAKQHKQNTFFNNYVDKMKNKTFIKVYYN
tara:strand:- start:90 stop:1355 length:1266 start_codon:yes stop_codon:yes gene_type:complete